MRELAEVIYKAINGHIVNDLQHHDIVDKIEAVLSIYEIGRKSAERSK